MSALAAIVVMFCILIVIGVIITVIGVTKQLKRNYSGKDKAF